MFPIHMDLLPIDPPNNVDNWASSAGLAAHFSRDTC
jgi:hypothetical protein